MQVNNAGTLRGYCPKCGRSGVRARMLAWVSAIHWGNMWNVQPLNIVRHEPATVSFECRTCGYKWANSVEILTENEVNSEQEQKTEHADDDNGTPGSV